MADSRRGGISSGGNPPGMRRKDTDLARSYRHADAGAAHHDYGSAGSEPAGHDPTLTTTFERPHFPLSDVVRPDKADGEAKGFTTGDGRQDAILAGLEPGEMGPEPDHGAPAGAGGGMATGSPARAATPAAKSASRRRHHDAPPDKADGEAKDFTTGDPRHDAILSGLEPGEMGREE